MTSTLYNVPCGFFPRLGGKSETRHVLRIHGEGRKLTRFERAERTVGHGENRRNEYDHHATVSGWSQGTTGHQSDRLQGTIPDIVYFGPNRMGGEYLNITLINVFSLLLLYWVASNNLLRLAAQSATYLNKFSENLLYQCWVQCYCTLNVCLSYTCIIKPISHYCNDYYVCETSIDLKLKRDLNKMRLFTIAISITLNWSFSI